MTRATIATDLGDIDVELYDQSAPKTTANFVKLAGDRLVKNLYPGPPVPTRPRSSDDFLPYWPSPA